MDRAHPYELITQGIYNIEQSNDNIEELRQIAFGLYLLSGDEAVLERFNIDVEDCPVLDDDEDFDDEYYAQPEIRQPEDREPEQRQSSLILDGSGDPFTIPVTIEELIPRNGKRKNKFVDTGTVVEKDDEFYDSKIQRPIYRHNRRRPEKSYYEKMNCKQCGREDEVDKRTIFKGSYQHEYGYHCPRCMRNLVTNAGERRRR